MIAVRRAGERIHLCHQRRDVWRSGPRVPDVAGLDAPALQALAGLEALDELRLPPGAPVPVRRAPAELVTYVREGSLTCTDAHGGVSRLLAGEFQRRAAARGTPSTGTNPSSSAWAHVFQLWLRPTSGAVEPPPAERRFTAGHRRGDLYVVASPDGRARSTQLAARARVASAILRRGQHVVHVLPDEHTAWLHVVVGVVALGALVLTTGDGVAVVHERALSVTAREDCELLLVELEPPGVEPRSRP